MPHGSVRVVVGTTETLAVASPTTPGRPKCFWGVLGALLLLAACSFAPGRAAAQASTGISRRAPPRPSSWLAEPWPDPAPAAATPSPTGGARARSPLADDERPPILAHARRAVRHEAHGALVKAGTLALTLSWSANTLGSLAGTFYMTVEWDLGIVGPSLIPVVGPFVFAGFAVANESPLMAAFGIGNGVVQLAGLSLLVAGLVGHDVAEPTVALIPSAPLTEVGVSLAGSL